MVKKLERRKNLQLIRRCKLTEGPELGKRVAKRLPRLPRSTDRSGGVRVRDWTLGVRSRGLLMVIAQEPTQSLAALHGPLAVDVCIAREQQEVALPLMIALSMVMRNIFA